MRKLLLISTLVFMAVAFSNKSGGGTGSGEINRFSPGGNKSKDQNGILNQSGRKGENCLFADGNLCVEFAGRQWSSEQIRIVCADYQGTIAQSSCRAGSIIGECTLNKGLENEAVMKYYTPITRANAALDCDSSNGIFR
jgi:hypothetical protein